RSNFSIMRETGTLFILPTGSRSKKPSYSIVFLPKYTICPVKSPQKKRGECCPALLLKRIYVSACRKRGNGSVRASGGNLSYLLVATVASDKNTGRCGNAVFAGRYISA